MEKAPNQQCVPKFEEIAKESKIRYKKCKSEWMKQQRKARKQHNEGDGNNMAHSLLLGCAMMGMNVRIATPKEYQPDTDIVEQAIAIANNKTEVTVTDAPTEAIKGTNVIYTDVWTSMGQEEESATRIKIFQPYQVNPI